MGKKIDLKDQIIGNILVLEETNERKNKSVVWKCKCLLCENICFYSTKELRSNGVVSCSTCNKKREPKTHLTENIIGNIYNDLQVNFKTKNNKGECVYSCTCLRCGKKGVLVDSWSLKNNKIRSCGCIRFKFKKDDIINNRLILDVHPEGPETGKRRHHNYLCKCLFCKRTYIASSENLIMAKSCGCIKSMGETEILQILQNNNINYIYQYKVPELGRQSFDFAILNNKNEVCYLIEFDGEQHYEYNVRENGWNNKTYYEKIHQHDLDKNNYAKEKNIPLIRIPYWNKGNLTIESIFNLSLLDLKKVMEENNNYDEKF